MKVVIADSISSRCRETLEKEPGMVVVEGEDWSAEQLREGMKDCLAVIVRSRTRITREIIESAPHLRVIGRAGTGIDNIDVEAATQRGILVMNTPGENTISAAEHTFCLLLALSRMLPQAAWKVAQGGWRGDIQLGVEVYGKTLGVIGLGRVGREVVSRAKAFGMQVVGHDPFLTDKVATRIQVPLLELDELLRQADFLTLHTPLTEKTRHCLGKREFALCKRGMRIVNCARGGLIDETALIRALDSGQVGGAALDVFEKEPPGKNPILGRPDVIATPHLGASTREALDKVAVRIAEQVIRYLREGAIENSINAVGMDPEILEQLKPFRWLAERLGRLHAQLAQERLQEVTVEYTGGVSEYPMKPITSALLKGYLEHFLTEPVNDVNAVYLAEQNGIHLKEIRSRENQDFANLITATFQFSAGERTISGTLFGRRNPRIVRLDNYFFDAIPQGEILICSNDDRPGIIGRLGTILGNRKINIAHLSMGRDHTGGRAVAIFNLDEEVPPAGLREIEEVEGIIRVQRARL
ncbi:MAG: phosphoglycerate dehydrogenase [Acidobacteriota bacterium]